jgi:hypothetical protein
MDRWVYKVTSISTEMEFSPTQLLTSSDPGAEVLEKWLETKSKESWELVAFLKR